MKNFIFFDSKLINNLNNQNLKDILRPRLKRNY